MQTDNRHHRSILQKIARRAMIQRGLLPDFSNEALARIRVQLISVDVDRGYIDFRKVGPSGHR